MYYGISFGGLEPTWLDIQYEQLILRGQCVLQLHGLIVHYFYFYFIYCCVPVLVYNLEPNVEL